MFTYQVRERQYKHSTGQELVFPNIVELTLILQPPQPFGLTSGGGRTAVRNVAAKLIFNANSGHHFVESSEPLQPLEVVIQETIRRIELQGNSLQITERFDTLLDLDLTLHSLYFGLPILLNVEFADPPYVERVEGRVGDVPVRWELDNWRMELQLTTQEEQENKVLDSWNRFDIISQPSNRRLLAALHYFHIFCRLCRAGNSPWEFMSEALVNLSKVLEVLFPATGEGQTIDAARRGLLKLNFSNEQIEGEFIPAIVLRSNVDSAHVDLSIFTTAQLRVLHSYTGLCTKKYP